MDDFFLPVLGYAGVAVFAAAGALAASRKQMDIIGFAFLASITGVGGGTIRDLLLGKNPVFWVADPSQLGVCLAVAVIVYFTAHLAESRYRLLLWADAVGLAAYAVLGAAEALDRSAGIAAACGADPVVFHPGFLLGRSVGHLIAALASRDGAE